MTEWSPSKLMIFLLLSSILLVSSTGVHHLPQLQQQPLTQQQLQQPILQQPQPLLQAQPIHQSSPPQPHPSIQQVPLLQHQAALQHQQELQQQQAASLASAAQSTPSAQLTQSSPQLGQLQSPGASLSQPAAATSLSLSNTNIDDELLRCPAVEFLPALKMNENTNKYQIQFIPQDDVKWVIAHLQVNEGVQLNVPLNVQSSRDQTSEFERLSKHLEQDEQDNKEIGDEELFNRELDDLLDQFPGYSKRSRFGGRMGRYETSGSGTSGMGAAASVDPPAEQRWTKPEPSFSVTHKADMGGYSSGMAMNDVGGMQSGSGGMSPNPQLSSPFATMGQAKSSMNRQQNEFLTKQIRLARAMIAMKEGQSGTAPMRGEVGVWIHNDGIDLNDNDVLRVWFTYRATEEPMAVDCDTHTFLFNNEGLKRTPVTTLSGGEKKAESLKVGGGEGDAIAGERQAIPGPLQRTRQWKKGGMHAKPMRGTPKAWGRMKGIVPAQLTTTISPFGEESQRQQSSRIGAAQATPNKPFAGPTTKTQEPSDEEICASATGDAHLKLQYPDLALAGEKNTYALILNITTPDNIRWVDVHYLAEGSRLVKLRMSPIPSTSVVPQTWKVQQPLKGGLTSGGFRKSLAMNLAQPQWIQLDNQFQGQQGGSGMKQMNVDPMNGVDIQGEGAAHGSVRGNQQNLFAEGSLLFSGSINASDISHIEIDPKTGQPVSVSIGELTLSLNVVGLPGSTFVLVANDDASDLRHWKSKLQKMPSSGGMGEANQGGEGEEGWNEEYENHGEGEYSEGQYQAQQPEGFTTGTLGGQLQQGSRPRLRGEPTEPEDIGEEEEYYPPSYQPGYPQRRPFIPRPFPPGMGPLVPPNVPAGMIPPWMRRPGIRPGTTPGEAEEETPLGPQLFQHPNGLMLNEGDKIRVFFSFFSPPVYCRTKSFTLIAPNVTHAATPEPKPSPTPSPTPSPAPAPTPSAPTTNETSTPSNETGAYQTWLPLKLKMTSRQLAFGRVQPGQYKELSERRNRRRPGRGYPGQNEEDQQDQFNRPRRRRPIDRLIPTPTSDQTKKAGEFMGGMGGLQQQTPLTCQQMMNFSPKLSLLKGLSNHELDQNNYAIVFKAPQGNEDSIVWVDVHYQKNNEVERNYRMEMISFGRFEHIEPGWHEGIHLASCSDVLKYSFTFRLEGNGEEHTVCDTQQFLGTAGKCQQQPSGEVLQLGGEGPSIPGPRPFTPQQRLAGSGIFHRFRASPSGQRLARRLRSRARLTTGGTGSLNAVPLTSVGTQLAPPSPQLQPMIEKGKKEALAVPLIPVSPSPSSASSQPSIPAVVEAAPQASPAAPAKTEKAEAVAPSPAPAAAAPSPSPEAAKVEPKAETAPAAAQPAPSSPAPSKTTSEAAPSPSPAAESSTPSPTPARVGNNIQISPSMTPSTGAVPAVWTTQQPAGQEVEEKKK